MPSRNPVSTFNIAGHPLHPILVTIPIGLFVATLLFDLLFWWKGADAFAVGATWLLGAGLVGAALAAIAGLTDFAGDARIRALSYAWYHAIGNVILVLIQAFNLYERLISGAAAVIPLGLSLSVIAVCLMLVNGWLGGELVFRHRVAVNDDRMP